MSDSTPERLGEFQRQLRRRVIESGEFYLVATTRNGVDALRVTLINLLTTAEHLDQLLETLRIHGRDVLDGRKIDYRVVCSKAARKLRVRVGPSGVEIVQPATRSNGEVDKFLHGNTAWIIGQMARVARLQAIRKTLGEILYRGTPTPVRVQEIKAFQSVEAALASAAAHLKLLEAGTPPEVVAEAEAQLDSTKAGCHHAKLLIELCSITSPIDGLVVQLLARQGQQFSQARPLATVTDLSEIFVHLRIPSAQFALVRAGTLVEVALTSLPGQTFSAKVVRINGVADPLTGNIDAFAAVAHAENLLCPGVGTIVGSPPSLPRRWRRG